MRYYTTGKLSENILETPEGYLLCVGAAIARTGTLEYLPEEMPPELSEGLAEGSPVKVYRVEADLFADTCLGSFEGKPLTLDHPDDFVTPETWKDLTVGIAQNIRRGAGKDADLVLADLLITSAQAIEVVRGGQRELSCGYDADYEATGKGQGKQRNIIGNHVALVEKGRCGARCKIKDSKSEESDMTKKQGFWDRLLGNPKVQKAMDEALAEEAAKPAQPENPAPAKQEQQATDSDAKLDEIILLLRGLAEGQGANKNTDEQPSTEKEPAKDEEQATDADPQEAESATKTGDKAAKTADADTVRRAALLAPHLRVRLGDSLSVVQRSALRSAVQDAAIQKTVAACLHGQTLDSASLATVQSAFIAASEVAALRNNKHTADALSRASTRDFGKSITPADINRMNREYHDTAKAGR